MGTPAIAVPALQLLATRADVSLVITQPDRPAGRGLKLTPPPIKVAALELGLPVWQPESMRGAESDPRLTGQDLFVVMAYGEILRQAVLDLPKACINLHGSLLPRWRGASPLQASIRAGDRETGVCVMEMVPALDAGPVYLSERIPLDDTSTLPWLHDRMAETAAVALGRFLDAWPNVQAVPQDDRQATMCRKLTSDDGRIDWTQTAYEIDRQIRAYTPQPGCWTLVQNERIKILAGRCRKGDDLREPGFIQIGDEHLIITAGKETSYEITRLQVSGRKAQDVSSFLRGMRDFDTL